MTEITIELDRVHRAIRSGNRWAIMKRMPDGGYDTLRTWAGGRRSLFRQCEEFGIAPTRQAEAQLAVIPESDGFKDR